MAVSSNFRSFIEKNNIFEITNVGTMVSAIVKLALGVGTILTLAYLIWGGIDWITSSGDKAQYEEARNKITHAVIGLTILACSWAIWQLLLKFFGLGKGGSTVELDLGT